MLHLAQCLWKLLDELCVLVTQKIQKGDRIFYQLDIHIEEGKLAQAKKGEGGYLLTVFHLEALYGCLLDVYTRFL